MTGRFKLFLIGTSAPLDVDLPARDAAELERLLSVSKFIVGNMADPNEDGVCPGILVPTCRVQAAIEAG